jgi:hypothetical protein
LFFSFGFGEVSSTICSLILFFFPPNWPFPLAFFCDDDCDDDEGDNDYDDDNGDNDDSDCDDDDV